MYSLPYTSAEGSTPVHGADSIHKYFLVIIHNFGVLHMFKSCQLLGCMLINLLECKDCKLINYDNDKTIIRVDSFAVTD